MKKDLTFLQFRSGFECSDFMTILRSLQILIPQANERIYETKSLNATKPLHCIKLILWFISSGQLNQLSAK